MENQFWHGHQDWTFEVHESPDPEWCGRAMRNDCKTIAKFGPNPDDDVIMLIEAHNALIQGNESKDWHTSFRELQELRGK